MSHRQEDEPLIQWLRRLQDRIDRLEKGDKRIRQNDIRLGGMLVSDVPATDELVLHNLATGTKTPLGPRRDVEWSFSGELVTNGDATDDGPGYRCPNALTACEFILGLNSAATAAITVRLTFPNNLTMGLTLPAGETFIYRKINVPLLVNDLVYPTLIDEGADAFNLSVHVRFGLPDNDAENQAN